MLRFGTRARAILACSVLLLSKTAVAVGPIFASGDVFVSLEYGAIQWRLADGTLNRVIVGSQVGTTEGMGFDRAGNLYVARWCNTPCVSANNVEVFNTMGVSTVGNYETSNVYRFDLASGVIRGSFNTGTAAHTVIGVSVKK